MILLRTPYLSHQFENPFQRFDSNEADNIEMATYHHNERAIDAGENISESPLPPPPIPPSRPSLSKTPTKAKQIRTKITSTMKDGEIGTQFESHSQRIENRMPSVSTIRKRFQELNIKAGVIGMSGFKGFTKVLRMTKWLL